MENNSFMDKIKLEDVSNSSVTENGALGYKSTGSGLVDLNFKVPSLRGMSEEEIYDLFMNANREDERYSLRWLAYLRDPRGGIGERKTFRAIIHQLILRHKEGIGWVCSNHLSDLMMNRIDDFISFIKEYGRWDDIFAIWGIVPALDKIIAEKLLAQINNDLDKYSLSRSLLAKWLPSINTSSWKQRKLAKELCQNWGWSYKEYRKRISYLRGLIKVVEKYMSANNWVFTNYNEVPTYAHLRYSAAFERHDGERYHRYIESLKEGKTKINASVAFPHDIWKKILRTNSETSPEQIAANEEMWKALSSEYGEQLKNHKTIVVWDSSGSMLDTIPGTKTQAIDVAGALGVICSENLESSFKDKMITFSKNPRYMDLSDCHTILEKVRKVREYSECSNTNIAKVFELILDTAIKYNVQLHDMPESILIISDMEFDNGVDMNDKLFDEIQRKFVKYGYQIPKVVFWNVNSRTNTIPMTMNPNGVILISGFSVNLINMIFSKELDPQKALYEILDSPRYEKAEQLMDFSYSHY